LIVAGEASEATVIESYASADDATSFTNAVSEIVVGPHASVTHYKLQQEGARAFHIATIEARQGTGSRFASHAISLGALLSRTDINTTMEAEGTTCTFDGLYLAGGDQHVDHHTSIDHRRPHGTSRELYKGILDGRATGVFNGKVFVRPRAQKSDAQQMNKNLLLSDDAVINTKPQLEIFADDVKCSHGATIGRLSDDALFYLRARGIDAPTARQVLIYAFANELIERIGVAPLRERLGRALRRRLPGLLQAGDTA
jgi:Fe-S cluster assembly protein SufD